MLLRYFFRLTGALLSGSAVALLLTALVQLVPDPTEQRTHPRSQPVARQDERPAATLSIQRAPLTEATGAVLQPAALAAAVALPPVSAKVGPRQMQAAVAALPDPPPHPPSQRDSEQGPTVAQAAPDLPRQGSAPVDPVPSVQAAALEQDALAPGPVGGQNTEDNGPAIGNPAAAGDAHARAVAGGRAKRTGPITRELHAAHAHRGQSEGPRGHRHATGQALQQVDD